jgi:DNA-binding transcriptional regulator of glucitol operon
VRRVLLRPRWLALHALALVLVVACLVLGRWQLGRAFSGNALSVGYALEWPAFAVFVVIMWWRIVRDALAPPTPPAPPQEVEQQPQPGDALGDEDAPAAGAHGQADDEPDDELAAYNRYLARLNAQAERRR